MRSASPSPPSAVAAHDRADVPFTRSRPAIVSRADALRRQTVEDARIVLAEDRDHAEVGFTCSRSSAAARPSQARVLVRRVPDACRGQPPVGVVDVDERSAGPVARIGQGDRDLAVRRPPLDKQVVAAGRGCRAPPRRRSARAAPASRWSPSTPPRRLHRRIYIRCRRGNTVRSSGACRRTSSTYEAIRLVEADVGAEPLGEVPAMVEDLMEHLGGGQLVKAPGAPPRRRARTSAR